MTSAIALADALKPFNPRLRGLPEGLPNTVDVHTFQLGTNFTLDLEGESLDLLAEMSGIGGYEQVAGGAEQMTIADRQVKVLSLAHLIASKRAAGRQKDLATLPLLEATLDLIRQG